MSLFTRAIAVGVVVEGSEVVAVGEFAAADVEDDLLASGGTPELFRIGGEPQRETKWVIHPITK